ncbi:hypothetical protein GQX73_g9036 [Xylaria multiplex]|uniref:Uncharacterized protein n=1 Tax=Xylaria multiplex TaxID=323545 RepID=A0A7C8MSJ5_9PEZI|nr:hypothetical protein GQX73_g9036 [Xylaria multiplex]
MSCANSAVTPTNDEGELMVGGLRVTIGDAVSLMLPGDYADHCKLQDQTAMTHSPTGEIWLLCVAEPRKINVTFLEKHPCMLVECGFTETERTLVLSGRPLRMRTNEYIAGWHAQPDKIKELCDKGIVPIEYDFEQGNEVDPPHLMGQVAGLIQKIQPAREIVDEMVAEATAMLKLGGTYLSGGAVSSKL